MTNKLPQKDYGTCKRNVQLLIDESFAEKVIPADDSVRLLDQMVEEMDLTPLMRAYDVRGRKPATEPSTMLKIVLYANMEGIYSSRSIRSSCQRDINFIWLLNGAPAPSYHEIARFRSQRLSQCAEELFFQIVKALEGYGEIKFEHLFVDGTKIEANANKYSFVWKKSTTKYEARNGEKLKVAVEELSAKYGIITQDAEELESSLRKKVTQPFVHGRGHRKTELQRDIEMLEGLREKGRKYAAYQETFQGRNSFSKTDPDATFMHMKEDHMRNAQLKPGYNIQFGVEGEYITGVSVSSERNDQLTLIPFMENLRSHGIEYRDVTADAGYESEENYSYFEVIETECYIKPQNYERSKTKKFKSNMALRENMPYDPTLDEYTCQAGQKIRARYAGKQKTKSGYEREVTYYECDDCSQCPFKKKCTRAKGNRKLQVSKKFISQRAASLERITSPEGIILRMNRSIQSEGAFGVVKQDYGFRQFLLRGNRKVTTEILLIAMAYNVNKLHAKIQQNRTGTQLFKKDSA
jgi:transposase